MCFPVAFSTSAIFFVQSKNGSVDSTQEQLSKTFANCDAVIACPGSRQSGIAKTCGLGARKAKSWRKMIGKPGVYFCTVRKKRLFP